MEKEQSYYMVIPASVWGAEISPQAKLLYGHITVLANKNGYAYCSNTFLAKILDAKIPSVKTWLKQLTDLGVIKREVTYKDDSKEIELRKIYITNSHIPASIPENTSQHIEVYRPGISTDPDNNTRDNNTSNNINPDDERLIRIKNLFWKKLVPAYPMNRIGNRQHAEKKWLQLEDKEMVQAIKNLDRYLTITGPYVKQLQNYLVERCFTEQWLKAEEKTKTKKEDKTNTKTFKGNYDSIN
jgi:hypothetical protein